MDTRFVILTTVKDELRQLRFALKSVLGGDFVPEVSNDLPGRLFIQRHSDLPLVIARSPEMGMVTSSTMTTHLILRYRPQFFMMSGIMAGIRGEVNLGDVIVADPSWDSGAGKLAEDPSRNQMFLPDPRQERVPSSFHMMRYLNQIEEDRRELDSIQDSFQGKESEARLKLYIGPVASGAAVAATDEAIKPIKAQSRKVIGYEMEIYGMYYAAAHCSGQKPEYVAIKAVSDFADSKKDDSVRSYAAYTSAAVVARLVKHLLDQQGGEGVNPQ